MTLKTTLGYALYVGSLVLARPSVNGPDQNSSQSAIEIESLPSIPSNLMKDLSTHALPIEPITSLDVIGSKDIHIKCDGATYGFDLNVSDCGAANAHVPASSDQYQWAERRSGSPTNIFPLPYRSMGDNASCYIQPVLVDGASSALATLNEARNAAALIRGRCYSGGKLQGGIATNIGMMKTLLQKGHGKFGVSGLSSLRSI